MASAPSAQTQRVLYKLAILSLLVACGAESTQGPSALQRPHPLQGMEFGTYHALIIGNENYRYLRQLDYAIDDSEALQRVLTRNYDFKVTLLRDATRTEIIDALYALRRTLTEYDNLLIYYSGHGSRDEPTEIGYWQPIDARPEHPAEWISPSDLRAPIQAMRAKHVLIISDSCFAGIMKSAPAHFDALQPEFVKKLARLRARQIMTSGGDEPVIDGGGSGHSVFARALLEALTKESGVFDANALYYQVLRTINHAVVLQSPQMSEFLGTGHKGGNFLFVPRAIGNQTHASPPRLGRASPTSHSNHYQQTIAGHSGPVLTVAFSPDGQYLATGGWDHLAMVWNVSNGRLVHKLTGHSEPVGNVAFSPDGQLLVTASWDGTAKLWSIRSGHPLHTLSGSLEPMTNSAFSANSRYLVTAGTDNQALLWDTRSGQLSQRLEGHKAALQAVTFSPDGSLIATASADTTARLWDAATGKLLLTFEGHQAEVSTVAFSGDGERILTTSRDSTASLWHTKTGKRLHRLKGHEAAVASGAFCAGGKHVVTTSWDHSSTLWNTQTGHPIATLVGHEGAVLGVAASPDGMYFLTVGEDATALLWDAQSGRRVAQFQGHTDSIAAAAFSPDSRSIATASFDGSAILWSLPSTTSHQSAH